MDSAKSPPLKLPHVPRLPRPFSVRPPGSKSIANRVLPLAALAVGTTVLDNLPEGDDVALMRQALRKLGFSIKGAGPTETFQGSEIFRAPEDSVELFLGNSGTATRILTALFAAGEGTFRVTGAPRMYERPIGDLIEALLPLCGETKIQYDGKVGYPPLTIHAHGLTGGKTSIHGNLSSQFVTGLLMAMPLCKSRVEVEVIGTLVSAPYVDITLHVMNQFGANVERDGYRRFSMTAPRGYNASVTFFSVEPDASSASYFLAAAAITGGNVTITNLFEWSSQGESKFIDVMEKMGAQKKFDPSGISLSGIAPLHGIDIDMDLMSDTGMTLAVVALFAEPTPDNPTAKTIIRNVGNWRLKETDRLAAMAKELRKLGAEVEASDGEDWISIIPPKELNRGVTIDTYDDHRMAMCFSLVSLGPKGVPVTINDPDCVRKTYPGYWKEFAKMTGRSDEN